MGHNNKNDKNNLYSIRCSTSPPQLVIILVSTSLITDSPVEDNRKVETASSHINKILNTVICKNFDGEFPKNRYYFYVISYGKDVKIELNGFLRELDEHPLRIEVRKKIIDDGAGGKIAIDFQYPVWVDLSLDRGNNNTLYKAIKMSSNIITQWKESAIFYFDEYICSKSLAPIVLNITYENLLSDDDYEKVDKILQGLKSIDFPDGNPLFYNLLISNDITFRNFPLAENGLFNNSLLNLSSIIPYNHQTRKPYLRSYTQEPLEYIGEIRGFTNCCDSAINIITANL